MYNDMRSHTVGFHDHGNRIGLCPIKCKNLNTKSSAEAELVGVDDVSTQVIWTLYFLKEQEYDIRENVIYQFNHSTIKLRNNGR